MKSTSACAVWLAVLLAAACARDPATTPSRLAARVITLSDADQHDRPIDLIARVRSARGQGQPIEGDVLRRVRCLAVLDVDRLEIESDRGREVVRIHGLDGRDPRWPAELDSYLSDTARPALERWLCERGTELFERSLAAYGAGGAAIGPCYPSLDGFRIVTLVRKDAKGTEVDVRSKALVEGWSYKGVPYADNLGVDGRFALAESRGTRGLFALERVRSLLEAFDTEARDVAALDDDALQLIGDELHASVASWLAWTPSVAPTFRGATPDEACEPFVTIYERWTAATQVWASRHQAELRALSVAAGRNEAVEVNVKCSPPDVLARTAISNFDAYSPAGPDVWFLRKGRLSRALLEAVLAHEIVHQYQEEVIYAGELFPPLDGGGGALEAHAECIAAAWVRTQRAEWSQHTGFAYQETVPHFEFLKRTQGLSDDELLARFRSGTWDATAWSRLADYEVGMQEWLFRETGSVRFDGLDFSPVDDREGQVVVDIRNTSDAPFRGQLHGIWLWKSGGDPRTMTTMRGAPFNVRLAPGASIQVRLAEEALWKDVAVDSITGLVSRTFAPLD